MRNMYLEYDPKGESNIKRDTKNNLDLFDKKKTSNSWSTNHIRFEWEKIY